jgi:hypothetical protein
MARPLRLGMPGGEYHVTCRGLERRVIVRDDVDRARWLGLLGDVVRRRDWRVLAWVLMDNHFHLFVRTPGGDISAGMHDLGRLGSGLDFLLFLFASLSMALTGGILRRRRPPGRLSHRGKRPGGEEAKPGPA